LPCSSRSAACSPKQSTWAVVQPEPAGRRRRPAGTWCKSTDRTSRPSGWARSTRLDRTRSFVEAYLQAVAHKLYRHVDVTSRHQELVDGAWELLSAPSNIPE
jgi:hypothetical protein